MKEILFLSIALVISIISLALFLETPTFQDITTADKNELLAGDGETCLGPYFELQCDVGLECVLISEEPFLNGVCRKIN